MVEPVVTYRVPGRSAEAEIEVKRSRFRCTLERVEDEAAARALVERLRREHWDARHHCSAFVVGPPPVPVERSSDDGEPAGTAGAPMLEVLRGAGLSDTAVVVTRWFGGTLLGAGGLVRAYGDAVRAAVARAGLLERRLRSEVAHIHEVGAGGGGSYGHRWVADAPTRLATLPIGYADGVTRAWWDGGCVLIGGKRRPIRGVVTMDQVVVEVDDGVAVGDEAVLLGG
ncbi:YigZ family protein, partial [uncultured Nocardioides sp.]|uniref:YigZ family protein n=1 Tax=uncultured Nocardioides sp. TaxID=198441 RepID=UPI00261CB917